MKKSKIMAKSDIVRMSRPRGDDILISTERVSEILEKSKSIISIERDGKLYLNDNSFDVIFNEFRGMLGYNQECASLSQFINLYTMDSSELLKLDNSKKYDVEVRIAASLADTFDHPEMEKRFDIAGIVRRFATALGRDALEIIIFGDKRLCTHDPFLGSIDGIKVLSDKNQNATDMNLLISDCIELEISYDEKDREFIFGVNLCIWMEPNMVDLKNATKRKDKNREDIYQNDKAIRNIQEIIEPFAQDGELIEDAIRRLIGDNQ